MPYLPAFLTPLVVGVCLAVLALDVIHYTPKPRRGWVGGGAIGT